MLEMYKPNTNYKDVQSRHYFVPPWHQAQKNPQSALLLFEAQE
jgi:hypothetical protein